MKTTIVLALTLTAGSALAQPPANAAQSKPAPSAAAATQVDPRFASWLGCWRLDDDLAGTGARLCVTPEKNGVRLQTVVGSNKGIDELIVPDGVAHPITDVECKGTERAEFSADNLRVFRTADVTCGKEAPRTVKSVAFLAGGPSLIHVQHVSGGKASNAVRVERYRRANNQQLADGTRAPQPTAQAVSVAAAMDGRWSIDDVIEASAKVPAEAVQASLAELKLGFDLSRKNLLALDKGGVQGEVIDLMVALTYPKKFVVERRAGSVPTGISTGAGWFDPLMGPMMSPMMMGGMAQCYAPYGYGYRSYYSMCGNSYFASPFAYDYYGYGSYYNPGYYGTWVNIGALPPGGSVEPQAEGRVIRGQGFTQIRNRESEPTPRVNAGGNGGSWHGTSTNGGVSSGGGFSSGSSSGASSGGSGDSGARVAVPKGGGDR